jgi:branched-subunit amino acid transport protein
VNELIVLVAAGIVTWSLRASAIVLVGGRTLPEQLIRACGYARHAVLSALVVAAVSTTYESGETGLVTPQMVGALAASLVAWRTGSLLATLAAGVGAVAVTAALWT